MELIQESRELFQKGKERYKEGHYSSSLQVFRKVVQVQEIVFGKYHKETIRSYLEMGKAACHVHRNSIDDDGEKNANLIALKAFQRASRMAKASLPETSHKRFWKEIESCWYEVHSSTDVSLGIILEIFHQEDMGDQACKRKHYDTAVDHYREALSLQDRLLGSDSLDGADIRTKLGSVLLKSENCGTSASVESSPVQAKKTLELAYECYLDQVGEDHPATMGVSAKMKTISAAS